MLRLAYLASNNGSSFRAIHSAIEQGVIIRARSALLVSNRAASSALLYAGEQGVPAACIPTQDRESAADSELLRALESVGADLIILSGYLKKLGPETLTRFEGRILNVHPALLPKFGGKGMYGRRVHEAVLAAGETVTGATIHLVDGEYDHGRVVAQKLVSLDLSDDAASVERKVIAAECSLFVETVRRISQGELTLPL